MRDLNDAERQLFYGQGLCPCCRAKDSFKLGPRGGLAVNVECSGCGTRLNVLQPEVLASPDTAPLATRPGFGGQLLWAPPGYRTPPERAVRLWERVAAALFGYDPLRIRHRQA